MNGQRMRRALLALAASSALVATGCGSDDDGGSTGTSTGGGGGEAANTDVSGNLEVVGIWTGDEQKSFQAVLDGFTEQYPDVQI